MLFVQPVKFNKVLSSVEMQHVFVTSVAAVGNGSILWILIEAISQWCVTRQTAKCTRYMHMLWMCLPFIFSPFFNVCSLNMVFNTTWQVFICCSKGLSLLVKCSPKMFNHMASEEVFYVNTFVVQSSFFHARILLNCKEMTWYFMFLTVTRSHLDFLAAF